MPSTAVSADIDHSSESSTTSSSSCSSLLITSPSASSSHDSLLNSRHSTIQQESTHNTSFDFHDFNLQLQQMSSTFNNNHDTTATPNEDGGSFGISAAMISMMGFDQEHAAYARKSQNMTECVPVPSSEHVAEIVGRQGCKIKALRAKTNTYIKTPVRGDEPVFIITGRKEDVHLAKKEILSAAEHFSQIRAARKQQGNNQNITSSGATNNNNGNNNNIMQQNSLLSINNNSNHPGGLTMPGNLTTTTTMTNKNNNHVLPSASISSTSTTSSSSSLPLIQQTSVLSQSSTSQTTIQVRVPYRVVGLVVGPKGATIKRIQQTTNTYIVTPGRDKEPIFEIAGLPDNVEAAKIEIESHIAVRTGNTDYSGNQSPTGLNEQQSIINPANIYGNFVGSNGDNDYDHLYVGSNSSLLGNGTDIIDLNNHCSKLGKLSSIVNNNKLSSKFSHHLSLPFHPSSPHQSHRPADMSSGSNKTISGNYHTLSQSNYFPLNDFSSTAASITNGTNSSSFDHLLCDTSSPTATSITAQNNNNNNDNNNDLTTILDGLKTNSSLYADTISSTSSSVSSLWPTASSSASNLFSTTITSPVPTTNDALAQAQMYGGASATAYSFYMPNRSRSECSIELNNMRKCLSPFASLNGGGVDAVDNNNPSGNFLMTNQQTIDTNKSSVRRMHSDPLVNNYSYLQFISTQENFPLMCNTTDINNNSLIDASSLLLSPSAADIVQQDLFSGVPSSTSTTTRSMTPTSAASLNDQQSSLNTLFAHAVQRRLNESSNSCKTNTTTTNYLSPSSFNYQPCSQCGQLTLTSMTQCGHFCYCLDCAAHSSTTKYCPLCNNNTFGAQHVTTY
ncbi:unnamed protein product [Didymodactylos carnosus]|uniref:RING-type domain-containing protein n=1 Tax=Didymodactylos carnosus TaxID=1234261 RepID=A0A813RRZ8_9BILA|nr:unnamed protein product [Didymodactylos carnosus]CAF1015989.1 unnamed protein product [Didymodactylos carnosus]CAF3568736.1 unnamed protein product [Didymodactylos carnosus]CAF3785057.1 unnamed protein product [Didymodactylos carnosus]